MATSKPDIMIILLSKLIEEGDSFYKVIYDASDTKCGMYLRYRLGKLIINILFEEKKLIEVCSLYLKLSK